MGSAVEKKGEELSGVGGPSGKGLQGRYTRHGESLLTESGV